MQRPTLLATLALSFALTACGGGGSDDPRELISAGNKALGGGDYAAALVDLEKAAGAMEASDPLYLEVQKGILRAKAGSAPKDAIAMLTNDTANLGDALDESLYSSAAVDMSTAGYFDEAIEVVKLATEKFGQTELMKKQVDVIKKLAASAGEADVASALAGLGYVD